MIRAATPDDMPALLKMGAAFFVEAGLPDKGVTFDGLTFEVFCATLGQHGLLLVAEGKQEVVGMIGVALAPAFWNAGVTLAQECFWYVDPSCRKGKFGPALLDEMQRQAAARGAILCSMVAEHGLRGDAVGQLYRRKGFAPAESTYWKRIGTWPSVQH
jgi:ribosomal protein S18 acetylase RimI-like enzyme